MNYYYYPQKSLEEQLYLFNQQPKDLSMEQLLSTPIPTLFCIQPLQQLTPPPPPPPLAPPPPLSPSSSPSSDSPILHDFFLEELLFMPDMECQQLVKKKKPSASSHKKSYLPGQCTMPIRVATHKPVRAPRHLACFNCKITKTPLWRRTPDRLQTLCNACGLYYKQYNQHRPLHIRHNKTTSTTTSPPPAPIPPPLSPIVDQNDIKCINCLQTNTPLWRKNEHGDPLCNACGLYAKLHHRNRPVEMRKPTIQRRRRDWAATYDSESQIII